MKTVRDMLITLRSAGHSDYAIARLTAISQPTINKLRQGVLSDTSYANGKRIEALLSRVAGEGKAQRMAAMTDHDPAQQHFRF